MPISKDQLFCRLAVRQGLLTKEEAVEFLAAFREDARVGQGIGEYLIDQGILDQGAADKIAHAIAQRAEGHVGKTKKRVPGPRGQAGHGHAHPHHHHHHHHRHHTPALPSTVKAGPGQITIISVGAVVLIVCVLVLIFKLQESSGSSAARDIEKSLESRPAASRQEEKVAELPPDLQPQEPEQFQFSEDELKALRTQIERAVIDARQVQGDGRVHDAIRLLLKRREMLDWEYLPADLKTQMEQELKSLETTRHEVYAEIVADIRKAKKAGDSGEASLLLEDLEEKCGPELRARAEKELE